MKKPVFFLCIVGGLIGAGFEMVDSVGASESESGIVRRRERLFVDSVDTSSAQEALCKEVEILLDEGYGVSSVEKRSVCRDPQ
jgi:hypothetical protein